MATRDEDQTGRFRCPPRGDAVAGERSEGVLTLLKGPWPGLVYTLDNPITTIGRSADADIVIEDKGLSRIHARVRREAGGFLFEDLGSTNGSFIDGQPVTLPHRLQDGDRIQVGTLTLLGFDLHDETELAAARMTRDLTMRDPLTRLFNRRHLSDQLNSEVAYARRHRVAMSVLMIDVDHFKHVNDEHGHATGDDVLRALAKALRRMIRVEDMVARFGGEEFVTIARKIDLDGARALGERLRKGVMRLKVESPEGPVSITVSVGVGHAPEGQATDEALLQAADEALYEAKESGRNRVVVRLVEPRELDNEEQRATYKPSAGPKAR